MLQCIPIRDLKNTTLISEMCHANDEPIMITKNGYQDMVIMSAEVYERIRLISTYEKPAAIEKEPIPEDVQEAQRLLKTLMKSIICNGHPRTIIPLPFAGECAIPDNSQADEEV